MNILSKLIVNIPDVPVQEIVIGRHSVLVRHHSGTGIASAVRYGAKSELSDSIESLTTRSLHSLAELAQSDNWLDASVGMAAINSVTPFHHSGYIQRNAKELILEKGRNRHTAIIGHFPFVEAIRNDFSVLKIFEKTPRDGDLEESEIPGCLPLADVVAVTGTTLTNHSIDDILRYVRSDAYCIILGPSTPLSPILFECGVNAVCGSLVADYDTLKEDVVNSVPVRDLQGLKQVCLFKEEMA